ncbi:MAG: hypothetical protein WEB79_00230 [Thermoleophilaceae bacterium]
MSDDFNPEGYHFSYDRDAVVDSNGNPPPDPPPVDPDRFLASMARFFIEGDEKEEARLLLASTLESYEESDDSNFEPWYGLTLTFYGPRKLYDLLRDQSTNLHKAFQHAAHAMAPPKYDTVTITARASVVVPNSADWRNELLAVLEGRDVDNQAIGFKATKTYEGLRFRSESEVRIAQALDRAGVMYVPNCRSRIGSVSRRRNCEADFLVMLEGRWGVLEVDGEQWHAGLASRDHERDRPFHFHGAHKVQRFDAGECFENPDGVVAKFLALLRRS